MDYNRIPVFYCKHCLGLAIKCDSATTPAEEGRASDEYKYCVECGSIEVGIASYFNWERMYEEAHGLKYLEWKGSK